MQFISSLIGGSGNSWLTTLFALGIVVVLIVLGVWLLKLLFDVSAKATKGRNRRLAVVDSLALDPKRQLLIIRRDNVEHLILTGGPHDLVIETGIAVTEQVAAPPSRRPLPVVPARKPSPTSGVAAPAAPSAPAKVTTATPTELPGAPGTVLAELQKQGRSTNKRAHVSLRHTGLLRPVSEMELPVSPEISVIPTEPDVDSAKQDGAQRQIEGTDLEGVNSETNRN